MICIHLQDAEAGVVIGHGGLTLHSAVAVHGEVQLGDAELIALRGQNLTVGVITGHSRKG